MADRRWSGANRDLEERGVGPRFFRNADAGDRPRVGVFRLHLPAPTSFEAVVRASEREYARGRTSHVHKAQRRGWPRVRRSESPVPDVSSLRKRGEATPCARQEGNERYRWLLGEEGVRRVGRRITCKEYGKDLEKQTMSIRHTKDKENKLITYVHLPGRETTGGRALSPNVVYHDVLAHCPPPACPGSTTDVRRLGKARHTPNLGNSRSLIAAAPTDLRDLFCFYGSLRGTVLSCPRKGLRDVEGWTADPWWGEPTRTGNPPDTSYIEAPHPPVIQALSPRRVSLAWRMLEENRDPLESRSFRVGKWRSALDAGPVFDNISTGLYRTRLATTGLRNIRCRLGGFLSGRRLHTAHQLPAPTPRSAGASATPPPHHEHLTAPCAASKHPSKDGHHMNNNTRRLEGRKGQVWAVSEHANHVPLVVDEERGWDSNIRFLVDYYYCLYVEYKYY
ncbi:hypothetical protein FPV67DRAFT_1452384 [Lyophyllum atratum]|nr:hypothetical protein FPV67DRAFT_1452384 [Lyophyllum atratum]